MIYAQRDRKANDLVVVVAQRRYYYLAMYVFVQHSSTLSRHPQKHVLRTLPVALARFTQNQTTVSSLTFSRGPLVTKLFFK